MLRHGAHPRILGSYGAERRDHALTMVNFVTWIGAFYKPWSRLTERVRDLFSAGLAALPGAREYILGLKFKPMSFYREGVVLQSPQRLARKNNPVGRLFMQPLVESAGKPVRLDDLIGPGFALIGVRADPWAALGAAQRTALADLQCRLVRVEYSKSQYQPVEGSGAVVAEDLQGPIAT